MGPITGLPCPPSQQRLPKRQAKTSPPCQIAAGYQRPTINININMSGSSFFTTTMQGGEGDPFDDTPPDPQGSYITKIVLHFDEEIEGIQV